MKRRLGRHEIECFLRVALRKLRSVSYRKSGGGSAFLGNLSRCSDCLIRDVDPMKGAYKFPVHERKFEFPFPRHIQV